MFGEPARDLGHVHLERTRYRQVEHSGSCVGAVFEVVGDATGDENEGTPRGIGPRSPTRTLMVPSMT